MLLKEAFSALCHGRRQFSYQYRQTLVFKATAQAVRRRPVTTRPHFDPRPVMRNLWWAQWHCNRLLSQYFGLRCQYHQYFEVRCQYHQNFGLRCQYHQYFEVRCQYHQNFGLTVSTIRTSDYAVSTISTSKYAVSTIRTSNYAVSTIPPTPQTLRLNVTLFRKANWPCLGTFTRKMLCPILGSSEHTRTVTLTFCAGI